MGSGKGDKEGRGERAGIPIVGGWSVWQVLVEVVVRRGQTDRGLRAPVTTSG